MELESDRLILRDATPDDAAAIFQFKQDPLVRQMALGLEYETTEERERADLERSAADEGQIYLILRLRDGDRPIGYIRVNWMERPRFIWLRFALGEERGKGYMKEALTAFLERLFAEGLHRADAEAFEMNEPSVRLMEGLGFQREGRKREAVFDDGEYRDLIVFGLLEQDFAGRSR